LFSTTIKLSNRYDILVFRSLACSSFDRSLKYSFFSSSFLSIRRRKKQKSMKHIVLLLTRHG